MSDEVGEGPASDGPGSSGRGRKRSMLVVLGLPGSGISLCATILRLLGVEMGEADAGPHRDLADLHRALMALFGRLDGSPLCDYPMPPGWRTDPRVPPLAERLRERLAELMAGPGVVGVMDPHTVRLVPLWNRIFADLDASPRYLICLREPADIAASMRRRSGLAPEAGELRVLDALVDALRHTEGRDRCFLPFDDWSDPAINLRKLTTFVPGLTDLAANAGGSPRDVRDIERKVEDIVTPALARSAGSAAAGRLALARQLYAMVSTHAAARREDEGMAAQIRAFTDNYLAFRQLLAPLEAGLSAALAEKEAAQAGRRAALLRSAALDEDLVAARIAAADARRAAADGERRARESEEAAQHWQRTAAAAEARGTPATSFEAPPPAAPVADETARLRRLLQDHATALSDAFADLAAIESGRRAAEQARRARPAT